MSQEEEEGGEGGGGSEAYLGLPCGRQKNYADVRKHAKVKCPKEMEEKRFFLAFHAEGKNINSS